MQLTDVMATHVVSVSPDTKLGDAARLMVETDVGAAVVIDEAGDLAGVITERDLMRCVSDGTDPATPVDQRMTTHVLTASPDTNIPEAMALMVDGHFRHLPVLDNGRVIGMVSMRDVMAWTAFRLRHGGSLEDDDDDAATGHIRGMIGWENAKVADPADDFATLVTSASAAAFDSVFEAYAHARVDRPDKHLEARARLAGELKLVSELLTAMGASDQREVEVCTARLRRLDTDSLDDHRDVRSPLPSATTSRFGSRRSPRPRRAEAQPFDNAMADRPRSAGVDAGPEVEDEEPPKASHA